MPADGVVQIAFDRYLLPSTISRQSIVLVDSANKGLSPDLAPLVVYDPVARTVTLAPPKTPWLSEGQLYKVILGIPESDGDGVRALDGATLSSDQKRDFAFLVGPKTSANFERRGSFCDDVLPIFSAKCSGSTCHGGTAPAAGLLLDSSAGVGATALRRVAQGASRGPSSRLSTASARRFGVDMPIIDAGNPGNSWLLYKVELAPPPVDLVATPTYACQHRADQAPLPFTFLPLAPNAQRYASSNERAILSDFILGREMPFPTLESPRYETLALTFEDREKIRLWISDLRDGQALPECGACAPLP